MSEMTLDLTDGIVTQAELTQAMFFRGTVWVSFYIPSHHLYLTGTFMGAFRESGCGTKFNIRVNVGNQVADVFIKLQ